MRERLARAGAPLERPGLVLGSGDDAAVAERAGVSATSVDALVEGIHFRVPPFTLADVGHKGLAVALSDLAAMGATPAEAFVQLGLSERHQERVLELADGIAALAAAEQVTIAGGDVTRSPILFLALTAVGSADRPEELVRRDRAAEGDLVVITGELGGAAAGLLLLERPELENALEAAVAERLRARQRAPSPRIAAGRLLAAQGASAMIDVSDGLAGDARHVAEASGVALTIELERLPVQPGVAEVAAAAGIEPERLVVASGEDYELLATLPKAREAAALTAAAGAGIRLTTIGRVGRGAGVELRQPDGGSYEARGYDQLRTRRGPSGPA